LLFGQPYTAIDCKNSDKVLHVTPANYSNLKTFGCFAYCCGVLIQNHLILLSRNVVFDEHVMLHSRKESIVSVGKEHGHSKD